MKRTLENCRLIKKYGAPKQYDRKCEGFAKSMEDDEPCGTCMKCKLHYINAEEAADVRVSLTEGADMKCSECNFKTLQDILTRLRAGDKEINIDTITDKNEIHKMIMFINDSGNSDEEKQHIIKIMNLLGMDIRPLLITHYYFTDNIELRNKGYEHYEPLRTEDMYNLYLPYGMHEAAEADIKRELGIQKWLNTRMRVIPVSAAHNSRNRQAEACRGSQKYIR